MSICRKYYSIKIRLNSTVLDFLDQNFNFQNFFSQFQYFIVLECEKNRIFKQIFKLVLIFSNKNVPHHLSKLISSR